MRSKKLQLMLLGITAGAFCNIASAQLFIDQATFTIQSGATVTVQGDVTSNTDILGTGKVILKGTANQNVNMGGFTIPNVEIDNTANVTLTGNAKVGSTLLFTNGKILLGSNNLTFSDVATASGGGTGKFVETNGTGQVIKLLTSNVTGVELPVGAGTSYRPAFVTSSGTYSAANVGVKVLPVVEPNAPPKISDYLAVYWPITKTGVTGTVTVAGQYIDAADITGSEANLRGYFYNGTDWNSTGETHDAALNRIAAPIATASGNLFGMDKFVLAKAKVFLQGAYNSVSGVMTDALRTPSNLIPLTDPYRSAPYNFIQVANAGAETVAASVFADQVSTNDNIVDWVFVELRNNQVSPGNTVLQTRSALLKRDGNIVDIDGKSPVTFNNTINGNYTVAVRHRNHLGISADPSTNLLALAEQKSTASLLDLTSATDAQIFGTSAAYAVVNGKNMLWSGNANFNINLRWNPPSSDKDFILASPLILNGVASSVPNNVYNVGDVNMDRRVRWNPPSSDKDFILSTSLTGLASTVRTQALPN